MQSQPLIVVNSKDKADSLLKTHKVLRNTYFLLALTLAFSAVVAMVSMSLNLPRPGLLMMLAGFYGLLFITHKFADSGLGILSTFAFTGFLGYTVGPILNVYISAGLSDLVVLALGGTAAVFFACSAYVLTTKKDMSFLSGMLFSLFIVLVIGTIASFFFNYPMLHVALSGLFVIFSSAAILYETGNIIHGGETNYIRATVSLFVSIYNLFISLLNLLSFLRDE